MRRLSVLLALVLLGNPLGARAQTSPVVLELFTSQGCSACPPADALLAELAGHDGVIALALHVDYWDYLGWADSFASPAFTARQRAYAKKARSRSIYTPQMIVQGEARLVGGAAEEILATIAEHKAREASVTLRVSREGDTLLISLAPIGPDAGGSEVHVVRFIPSREVAIEAGENAGHQFTYANIVTDWETVGRWDGVTPAELRYQGLDDEPDAVPGAVIVQRERMGPVLAAARFP